MGCWKRCHVCFILKESVRVYLLDFFQPRLLTTSLCRAVRLEPVEFFVKNEKELFTELKPDFGVNEQEGWSMQSKEQQYKVMIPFFIYSYFFYIKNIFIKQTFFRVCTIWLHTEMWCPSTLKSESWLQPVFFSGKGTDTKVVAKNAYRWWWSGRLASQVDNGPVYKKEQLSAHISSWGVKMSSSMLQWRYFVITLHNFSILSGSSKWDISCL